jgi:uncharacterized metal-binding protein
MNVLKPKGLKGCNDCTAMECKRGYPKGIPPYCLATRFKDIVERAKPEYSAPDVINIYKASGRVVSNGYGKWPRIQEAIEFAKELKLSKIGLASCAALSAELGMVAELFLGAGFDTITAICQIGRVSPESRGVTVDSKDSRGLYCNPIAQAEIFNRESTQLNFVLGLCLGHDILFSRYSKAPVSTLIVKDRVTGHNPGAALYCSSHHQALLKLYCGQSQ